MRTKHPETELIPYLRGELSAPDREQMAAHLAGCADCQRAVTEFRGLLDDLAKSVPPPPDLHWGRYQADLRDRLEARRRRRWWFKPVPLTLSAGLAGVLLFLTVQMGVRQVGPPQNNLTAFEETVLGSQLDLLRRYTLLERLDLLEDDLDLIGQLDGLVATGEV
jgi:anti-sigma factor RsiW